MLPADGVYAAVRVEVEDGPGGTFGTLANGVTNIGVRPTLAGRQRTIETFALDFFREPVRQTTRACS